MPVYYYYDKYNVAVQHTYSNPVMTSSGGPDPGSYVSDGYLSYSFNSTDGYVNVGTYYPYEFDSANKQPSTWYYFASGKTMIARKTAATRSTVFNNDQQFLIDASQSWDSTQTDTNVKGTLVTSGIIAADVTYPDDGEHTDGYWYVKGAQADNVVVDQIYDTSGNGGRKQVRLSNGWSIATAKETASPYKVYFYKSIDEGISWVQLCWLDNGVSMNGNYAICSHNTMVYMLWCGIGLISNNEFVHFDATTISNVNLMSVGGLSSNAESVPQGSFGSGCSLEIDSLENLHAAWITKSNGGSYTNSFNVRYSKSTDGGVTWDNPTQVSALNTSGADVINPCIVLDNSDIPYIFAQYALNTTDYRIVLFTTKYTTKNFNGFGDLLWGNMHTTISTYSQTIPCAAVAPNGRIWLVWRGIDSVDSTYYNIRIKYSDDGSTWVDAGISGEKITSQNIHQQVTPTISIDKNNNVYVLWNGMDVNVSTTYYQLRRVIWDGISWSSIVSLTNNQMNSIGAPSSISDNTFDFNLSTPPTIYQDNQAMAILFTGSILLKTQIGTFKIETTSGLLDIPIYDPAVGMDGKSQLRISLAGSVGCFELVDVTDANASPLRVNTTGGIKSISK